MYDAIVVGSGPAGTFAAYALRGKRVLVLDVGYRPPAVPPFDDNLYALRRKHEDLFEFLIGSEFESLRNLHRPPVSIKLKAPLMSYIVRNSERLSPLISTDFEAVMSFAQGGLANAWGAGVYPFTARDLEGFPITAAELDPYYREISAHIGISGAIDDLAPYFGEEPGLLPPLRLSPLAAGLIERYEQNGPWFRQRGITIGRPRLAVLTRDHRGRAAYRYDNLEFFRPHNPAIYNPAFTLDELVEQRLIEYRPGWLATRYREHGDRVEVLARNLDTGAEEIFEGRYALLAAGALNTAKLALASNGDSASRLPMLDNPLSCIPLFRPSWIGRAFEAHDSSLAQLNLIYDDPESGQALQATLYGTTGPLRSDVLFQLPLSISANLILAKYLAPAMLLVMLFRPGEPAPGNYIRLTPAGELEIQYDVRIEKGVERRLIKAFRKIGYIGFETLCQYPKAGNSVHYAGTLPMKANPGRYETYPDGRLSGTRGVYICDGACFTRLPAKNLTLAIMANAMRIATRLRSELD